MPRARGLFGFIFPFMLAIYGLQLTYAKQQQPALQAIDLNLKKGELLALVGESGSGKSSLLRAIAGLELPEKGRISIAGQNVWDNNKGLAAEQRPVGLVFQDYALFPHLTVAQNIRYGLRKHPRQKQRIAEVLDLVGLLGYEKRYPHELSGGQQQRVALARALAPEPSLLLLDEPFSNLDELLKGRVRRELRNILQAAGVSSILVTHDTKDALATADRLAVMQGGQIRQTGRPAELYHKPCSRYVADFFGPCNYLSGHWNGASFETKDLKLPPAQLWNAADWSEPQAVQLAIRPEQLHWSATAGLPVKVRQQQFLGYFWEIDLQQGGADWIMRRPEPLPDAAQGFVQIQRASLLQP